MALSNNFFGLRQGSTKSLTFQVYNGKQVTKDRVSRIGNPRTRAQMIQRAVIATVVRAYQAGQVIFDHSFQGYSFHDGAMARFLNLNARILRKQYFSDVLQSEPSNMVARFCAMSVDAPVACPGMIVSEGTLVQDIWDRETQQGNENYFLLKQPRANEKMKDWVARIGIDSDDIFTFISIYAPVWGGTPAATFEDNQYGKVYSMRLDWVRMKIKPSVFTDETIINRNTLTYYDVFDIDDSGLHLGTDRLVQYGLGIQMWSGRYSGVQALIRSRQHSQLRSTSYFSRVYNYTQYTAHLEYGLTADLLPLSWISNTLESSLHSGVPTPLNHAVDMGLPSGLLWADVNLDITQPDKWAILPYQYECSFCSWGNTDMYNPNAEESFEGVYDWGSINAQEPWYEGQPYGSTPGAALTENIGPANDVARHFLGALWRIPSDVDFVELFHNCDFIDANGDIVTAATSVAGTAADKRVWMNGIVGFRLRSKINGNIIFIPACGDGVGTEWKSRGVNGAYWASTLVTARSARYLNFNPSGGSPNGSSYRFAGMAIRPVYGAYNE